MGDFKGHNFGFIVEVLAMVDKDVGQGHAKAHQAFGRQSPF